MTTLTRPDTDQVKFSSAKTGDWSLDQYLQDAEHGNRTLGALLGDLFDLSSGTLKSGGAFQVERHVAVLNQAVFSLANAYIVGGSTLSTFVNGLLMSPGHDYTETTANSVTFVSPLAAGDEVLFHVRRSAPLGVADANGVTYTPLGIGAVSRDLQSKLREDVPVTPEEYGAIGDGTADDTVAIQRAIDTDKAVRLTSGKTYRITANVLITTNFQYFGGPGVIKPDGNCGVVITGACVGAVVDLIVSSASHSGTAITVDEGHRSRINLLAIDCFNAIRITKSNVCTIEWAWGSCRNKGITWYGSAAARSDVLHIKGALFSVGAGQYGLDWDGNCHSLEVDYLGIVCGSGVSAGNGYGAVVRNTSGGPAPAIGKFNHLEVDYSGTHGLDIQVGSDYDIVIPYILGATGAGIRVGAAINNFEVRVVGGKSRGNTTFGIEALGGVVLFGGATDLSSNTTAETTGNVWTRSPRFAVDSTHHISNNVGGNPLHTYDANDYTSYDRTNNVLADFIGGVAVLSRDGTRITFGVRPRLPVATVAALPAVHLAGDLFFASNGRKNGEGVAAGTGVLVFSDGTAWRACDTGATVAA